MSLSWIDIVFFLMFICLVVGISLYKSRKKKETSEDYFLAGRTLFWYLIGFSLIASNISTEQFVGMAGQSAGHVGMAVASYEWIAAITLVFVAVFFLPKFLKTGIFTIPEFLEHRYNAIPRAIMAFYTVIIYVAVTIAAVLYSGGLTLHTIFGIDLTSAVWIIGIIAAFYTAYGGLKAVIWADLIQGSALIIGGIITMVLGFIAVGGVDNFLQTNADRLHMVLPASHIEIPWTALLLGIWIPNFYYWGFNQYIMQRTLGARSLKQGQMGVIFAAGLKLLIPFIVVFPGIMALQLYRDQLVTADAAYPLLIKNLIPAGLKGFMFAAIFGAIMSSLDSMLNSASTIFTMDLYKRHFKKDASPKTLILTGRIMTVVFVLIGCLIAPQLGHPRFMGIFHYIQDFQGFISPGILAAFVFGLIFKRAPASAAITALILNVPVYGILHLHAFDHIVFLNKMAITFVILILAMTVVTLLKPLREPKILPSKGGIDMKPSSSVVWLGAAVIAVTIALYIIFW
ncbi:MAG: solute:sodium symporter family transporter [Candidatus Aminicenantes bacterium]|nr:MAG: solute:sodium symporter family transporter [Candidatus Aminicenantes bacterium]